MAFLPFTLKILVDTGSLETRHDIDELSKVIEHIVSPGEVIIILKTHRLGPRDANLPNSPRPLKQLCGIS